MIEQRERLAAYLDTTNDLGHLLRSIRKKMKLTQAKFGKMLDVTGQHVYMVESGKRLPSFQILQRLLAKIS